MILIKLKYGLDLLEKKMALIRQQPHTNELVHH